MNVTLNSEIEDGKIAKYLRSKENNSLIQDIWKKTFLEKVDNLKVERMNKLIGEVFEKIHNNIVIIDEDVKRIVNSLGKYAIITDRIVYPIIKQYLRDSLMPYCLYYIDDFNGNELLKVINEIKNNGSETLLGLGGGRVMDYLKFIQMKTNIFCVAMPSSLATHVYASPKIHILPAIKSLGYKKTIDGPVPDLVVLDIDFLEKLKEDNPRLIRAGLGDLMAFVVAIEDWKLAEKNATTKVNLVVVEMCEEVIEMLWEINVNDNLRKWISNYVFMQVLLCEITRWEGSSPASGSEHLFALAAEKGFDNPPLHGELVALGCLIMTHIYGKDVSKIRMLIRKLQLPEDHIEIGLSREQVVNALQNCKKIGVEKGRFTIINTLNMEKDFCEKVVSELFK